MGSEYIIPSSHLTASFASSAALLMFLPAYTQSAAHTREYVSNRHNLCPHSMGLVQRMHAANSTARHQCTTSKVPATYACMHQGLLGGPQDAASGQHAGRHDDHPAKPETSLAVLAVTTNH